MKDPVLVYLYHGDNGHQEFWETGPGITPHVAIIKPHGQIGWFVMVDEKCPDDIKRLEELRKKNPMTVAALISGRIADCRRILEQQERIFITLARTHKWAHAGKSKMDLVTA